MKVTLDFWSLILLFASLHGYILAAVLVIFKNENKIPNRWLGLALFVISSMLLEFFFIKNDIFFYDHSGSAVFLNSTTALLLGPAFYFYIITLFGRKISKEKAIPHLLLFTLCVLNFLPTYLGAIEKIFNSNAGREVPLQYIINNGFVYMGLMLVQVIVYLFLSYRFVTKNNGHIKSTLSDANLIFLDWLKKFSLSFVVMILFLLLPFLYITLVQYVEAFEFIITFGLAGFILYIGMYSLKQPEVHGKLINEKSRAKYEHSGLAKEEALNLKTALIQHMENDKPYLDDNLKLSDLAQALDSTNNNLSQLINQEFETSFFDLINSYRVSEVQQKLINPDYQHYTFLAIAMECGFSNKTSFNRVFKKFTGTTPSKFKSEKLLKQSA